MRRAPLLGLIAIAALTGSSCETLAPESGGSGFELREGDEPVSFEADVKPVIDRRCVVCHGCYDAPCQLLLSSPEGLLRGGSKQVVYDTSRLRAMEPTRLGIDPARGFHPVVGGDPAASLLFRMLALGAREPFAAGSRLPESVALDVDRRLSCAAPDEFDRYASEHPQGGMPYGTAPLSAEELGVFASWLARGASLPEASAPEPEDDARQWEAFLNGASLRERIVARYLFEHWFVAHLYFEDRPTGPFYRVVRSRTAPGAPIEEIATRRPFDDPGARFWYRLQPVRETIVHKTHLVYPLGPARLARLRELFLDADWKATELPSYAPEVASNPFRSFAELPARSRYQFLLDDAHYFVDTFIRGPVCRGQVAVDVIEDHFWVSFLDPDRDPSVTKSDYFRRTAKLLDLPAEHRGIMLPGELWMEFGAKQRAYLEMRGRLYDEIDPQRRGPALDWIWDGDGKNRSALLTVFRNFDSATVVQGFQGETPKTAWVIDYPTFERIYYNLVAGYDVFGNVGHQVATRLYMDHLRMQSENLLLGFLPEEQREPLRASWYVGARRTLDYQLVNKLQSLEHGTQVRFTKVDVKADLLEQIRARSPVVVGAIQKLDRGASERALARSADVKGAWVQQMPEFSLLRVRVAGARDAVYSLVRHAAHTNVAFMFNEERRRLPQDDTLSVMRGHFGGSYPNFFFEVAEGEVGAFVDALLAVASQPDMERFAARYGIRRTDARFWATLDWLHEDLRRSDPTRFGIYDINRYANL